MDISTTASESSTPDSSPSTINDYKIQRAQHYGPLQRRDTLEYNRLANVSTTKSMYDNLQICSPRTSALRLSQRLNIQAIAKLPSAFLVNLDEPTPLTFSTGLYATRSRVSTRSECVIVVKNTIILKSNV
ncbi:unnamed protein product [Trichogramma brassicae]|uniref:Uncharacterized protein n=1 Tax=Trichogramma brassicae TaxID=86971 RepID=A0A6H5I962_9HYME|nr:unnamed protein product [Trichogramma brassicae]